MKRNVSLDEISDGKLYGINDMVKAGCNDCQGCSSCCRQMGNSIILDPLDVHRLCTGLHTTFEKLLETQLELHVVDGIALPNLKMREDTEACYFLNQDGRCSIHAFRPGICRLFPLGRYYENHSFRYFLQIHECEKKNRSKVKVRKWIDTPDIQRYETYITDWHYFLNDLEELIAQAETEEQVKIFTMFFLKTFFYKPYSGDKEDSFYEEFYERLNHMKEIVK